jgi:hypothetical protein
VEMFRQYPTFPLCLLISVSTRLFVCLLARLLPQGPGAAVVAAQLLVWSAACVLDGDAASCGALDALGGVTPAQRVWLAVLATRRESLVVPTANCLGYLQVRRADAGGVDPNRDFSYSRRDTHCFRSSAARLFRALMERTIVQLVVTFHGGMVALGYEWGSPNHPRPADRSPDELAHAGIAQHLKAYAGTFGREGLYPGTLSAPHYYL